MADIVDNIGYWSETKLGIIEEYAQLYSRILANHQFNQIYIDGFAGSGIHVSKTNKCRVAGSPQRVVNISNPFKKYYFIEIIPEKVKLLESLFLGNNTIRVICGDCNDVFENQVMPEVTGDKQNKCFCLLDPYGMQLQWKTIMAAANSNQMDILVNFPIMAINRNVLRKNKALVKPESIDYMNRFWGDDSWQDAAYNPDNNMFHLDIKEPGNRPILAAFLNRLQTVAGFNFVSTPLAMKNTHNSVIYYLCFASHNKTAGRIVDGIFNARRKRGV